MIGVSAPLAAETPGGPRADEFRGTAVQGGMRVADATAHPSARRAPRDYLNRNVPGLASGGLPPER